MKTYLSLTVSSEGAKPSELTAALQGLGFSATSGAHDFEYEWPGPAEDVDEILAFADQVHAALAGMDCSFQMETV